MLNTAPTNKNYKNGLYIPKNKEKIIKLNNQGGLFFLGVVWNKNL